MDDCTVNQVSKRKARRGSPWVWCGAVVLLLVVAAVPLIFCKANGRSKEEKVTGSCRWVDGGSSIVLPKRAQYVSWSARVAIELQMVGFVPPPHEVQLHASINPNGSPLACPVVTGQALPQPPGGELTLRFDNILGTTFGSIHVLVRDEDGTEEFPLVLDVRLKQTNGEWSEWHRLSPDCVLVVYRHV